MTFFSHTQKEAAVILLGSNFDEIQETKFKFLKDLTGNYHVNVYSIDTKKDESKPDNVIGIDIHRLSTKLDADNIHKLLVDEIPKNTSLILVVDGIKYDELSDTYKLTMKTLKEKFKNAEIASLHYISPLFENPTINLKTISLDLLSSLGIKIDNFLDTGSDTRSNIRLKKSDKLEENGMYNLLQNLKKMPAEQANNVFLRILGGTLPMNNPKEKLNLFKMWLSEEIAFSMTLANLKKLETESLAKHIITPK